MPTFQDQLKALVSKDKIKAVFKQLLRIDDAEIQNQVILISSRFNALIQSKNLGTISEVDFRTEKNRITAAIVNIIDNLDPQIHIKEKPDREWINKLERSRAVVDFTKSIIGLLTAVLALIAGIWAFSKSLSNENDLDQIKTVVSGFTHPETGDTIKPGKSFAIVYYGKEIQENKILRIVAEQRNSYEAGSSKYYPMTGELRYLPSSQEWLQDNIVFGIEGDFMLMLFLLEKSQNQQIDNWYKNEDYGMLYGFLGNLDPIDQVYIHVDTTEVQVDTTRSN